jgi:endoglucanase
MYKIFKKTIWLLAILVSSTVLAQNFPTAPELAKKMTIGWNIGNTMEAVYSDGTGGETYWGNPLISQKLIDSVKAAGFNTIRIPIAWEAHSSNGTINPSWIARVKEVVDYCYQSNMFVIINIHWDNGWLEENCTPAKKDENNIKQANYWNQIATYFKDYDEHLLFASANEPHVKDATEMTVLLSYHQTFINTVRASGGKNDQRILIVQGPATDIEKTNNFMNTMPSDPASNRLMAEVHFYPYQFSLMEKDEDWGKQHFYWGTCNHSTTDAAHNPDWGEETFVDEMFQLMKSKFVDKGYPVILGEFGVRKRKELTGAAYNLHIQSREYYFKYVVKSALNHGLIPIYWCAGLGELFDRNTGAVLEPGTVNALMAGAYSESNTVNCGQKDCKGVAKGHAYTNECGDCVLGFEENCTITGNIIQANSQILIYPNPTHNRVFWNTEKDWILLDIQGKELAKGKGSSTDLSEFPNGVYFIKIDQTISKIFKN